MNSLSQKEINMSKSEYSFFIVDRSAETLTLSNIDSIKLDDNKINECKNYSVVIVNSDKLITRDKKNDDFNPAKLNKLAHISQIFTHHVYSYYTLRPLLTNRVSNN